jgi:hypothetical protein
MKKNHLDHKTGTESKAVGDITGRISQAHHAWPVTSSRGSTPMSISSTLQMFKLNTGPHFAGANSPSFTDASSPTSPTSVTSKLGYVSANIETCFSPDHDTELSLAVDQNLQNSTFPIYQPPFPTTSGSGVRFRSHLRQSRWSLTHFKRERRVCHLISKLLPSLAKL